MFPNTMRPFINPRLVALLALFAALCAVYNIVTPLFEAPDERDHVDYADWLASGNGLPHLVADRAAVGEIWQPPLYYALVAPAIAPIDRADLETIAPLSGDWRAGLSRVAHYHTAAEDFPWRGAALATHMARAVSTILGLITVLATYAIGRRLLPRHALVAAALVALNPQFIFMSAAVNNDNLVIALCSLALWMLVRLITDTQPDGRPRNPNWVWYAALGLVWGLAALAKLTGLTLGLVIGLTLLYLAWQRRSWRPLLLGGALTGGTMLLVCGWWFWRNWQLYGDPLAWREMLAVTGGLVRPALLSWPETLRYAIFLRQSYWAAFGYGILAPDMFYLMTTAIMVLATVGLALQAIHGTRRGGTPARFAMWILALWSLTVFFFLLRWMRQIDTTNQGRLLFPAIAALGVLGALGLAALDGRRLLVSRAVVVALGCWAAALPMLTIKPAYAQPQQIQASAIANPVDILFGDSIRLLGYSLPAVTEPGRPVEVTLYWDGIRPMTDSYIVAARILDPAGQVATGVDSLPAGGRYSTVVWEPGRPFRDVYTLPPVSADAVPGLGNLLVIVYPRGEPDKPLDVTRDGVLIGHEAYPGTIKISPPVAVRFEPQHQSAAVFDDRIWLAGYDVPETARSGDTLPLTLYWEAIAPIGGDYTVFVHLVNEAGELVAQSDGPPRAGAYPTGIWSAGEQVVDERVLALPPDLLPGTYAILIGLYDPATGARLPVYDADGTRRPDDAIELAGVGIVPPAAED